MEQLTTGEIADRLGINHKTLDYILRTRRFKESDRVSHWRLYDLNTYGLIKQEVDKLRARKAKYQKARRMD